MYDSQLIPIMNRGWHAHASHRLFNHPGPQPRSSGEDTRFESSGNALLRLVRPLYDVQWLFYEYASGAETLLTHHCGPNIILTRECGIVALGGDYEYALPHFLQPREQVHDTLLNVYSDPECLNTPEPNLLHIKFTGVNLRKERSGTVHLYDPINHTRRSFNVLQFVIYLEQEFNPLIAEPTERMYAKATANGTKPLGYGEEDKLFATFIGKGMLLANMFADHKIPFDRILNTLTRLGSLERTWQFLTLATRDGSLELHDQFLDELYPANTLHQVQWHRPTHIEY